MEGTETPAGTARRTRPRQPSIRLAVEARAVPAESVVPGTEINFIRSQNPTTLYNIQSSGISFLDSPFYMLKLMLIIVLIVVIVYL